MTRVLVTCPASRRQSRHDRTLQSVGPSDPPGRNRRYRIGQGEALRSLGVSVMEADNSS